jgi:streptogrisin C
MRHGTKPRGHDRGRLKMATSSGGESMADRRTARRRRRAITTGIGILALGAAFQFPPEGVAREASGGDDEPSAEHLVTTSEEALAEDFALVAEERGTSVDEVESQYAEAEALGDVAVIAAERWPDQFVGSDVSGQDDDGPTLYIAGTPAPELLEIAQANGVLVAGDQPFSFDELEERKLLVHHALEELGYKYVTTSFDVGKGGWIDAAVGGPPYMNPREILGALPPEVRDSVGLTASDHTEGWSDQEAYGGMRLRDNGTGVCTSGWAVVHNNSGNTGITGAGHCSGVNEVNHLGDGIHSLVFRDEHRGQWGDVEWYTSPAGEPPRFYFGAGDVRVVQSVEPRAGLSQNEPVCVFSRNENERDCSLEIDDVSISCTNSGVFNDRLVQMDGTAITSGGDSGASFFFGTRAFGSNKGTCGSPARQAFSVADLFDEALNVRVRQQ